MQDLDAALAEQTPSSLENTGVYDLPSLTLDGIPTPIDKMTQVVWNLQFQISLTSTAFYTVN